MNTFIVIFDEAAPLDEIAKKFGDQNTYAFSDNTVAIKAPSPHTADIRTKMDAEDDLIMLVLKLNGTYSGHYYKRFWNWMSPADGS